MSIYGLIIGIAIVIGIDYFQKHNQQKYFPYLLIFVSIIGARFYHVIEQWSYYSINPDQILATWNGGLSIIGAIIFGLVFILFYSSFIHVSCFRLLDSVTPILPLCQAIGRLGNFVNHENPIWWPEAILDLFLYFYIKKYPNNPTSKYLIGYGLIRFVTEFWRQDTWIYGPIKIGQLISIIFIVVGIFLWNNSKKHLTSSSGL